MKCKYIFENIEVKIAVGHRILTEAFLFQIKFVTYQECPTALSEEFEKSFIQLVSSIKIVLKEEFNLKVAVLKTKLSKLSRASPCGPLPELQPRLTGKGEYTAPLKPQLSWTRLHLRPSGIVFNAKNFRRSSICYFAK